MKYKVSIKKQTGFNYSTEEGLLKINEMLIEEPTDESIIEYNITESAAALGLTRCYRKDGEVICNLTLFVDDLEPYKNYTFKNGVSSNQKSKWDFSQLMTADEILNGNIKSEVVDV